MNDLNNQDNNSQEDPFDAESYWKRETGRDQEPSEKPGEYWSSLTDYGKGRTGDPDYGPIPEEFLSTGMSKAALICGIISLASIIFNYFGALIFGALGLVFALLSRGSKMSRQAKTGALFSGIGLAIFAVVLGVSFYTLYSTGIWDHMIEEIREMDPDDPDALAKVQQDIIAELQNKLMQEYYGFGSSSENAADDGGTALFASPDTEGTDGKGEADAAGGMNGIDGFNEIGEIAV